MRTFQYTVGKANALKENTPIGKLISFSFRTSNPDSTITSMGEVKTITGFVTEKYPHTFRLDDGTIYRWNDYMLGYRY